MPSSVNSMRSARPVIAIATSRVLPFGSVTATVVCQESFDSVTLVFS